jgi:hypothetical protein
MFIQSQVVARVHLNFPVLGRSLRLGQLKSDHKKFVQNFSISKRF